MPVNRIWRSPDAASDSGSGGAWAGIGVDTDDDYLYYNPAGTRRRVLSGGGDTLSTLSTVYSADADTTLAAAVGNNSFAYIGGLRWIVSGANLTKTGNVISAVHGVYKITGTNAGVLKTAVIGEIHDNTTTSTAAFSAILGGDQNVTTCDAAYSVEWRNSLNGSYFKYGLDMYGTTGTTFITPQFNVADIRFASGGLFVSLTSAITANTTTTSLAAGTLGKTTHATGRASLFVSDGSKWQFLTNS